MFVNLGKIVEIWFGEDLEFNLFLVICKLKPKNLSFCKLGRYLKADNN